MKSQIFKLKSISDAGKAAEIVKEISSQLQSDDPLLVPFLDVCLNNVLPYFKETFSVDTKINCIDKYILQPKLSALSILVSSLNNSGGKFVAATYLKRWTKENLYSKSIDYTRNISANPELYTELLAIIFSIPDRIANVFAGQPQDENRKSISKKYKPEYFFRRLALSITSFDSQLLSKFSILNLCSYIWITSFNAPQIAEPALKLQASAYSPFVLSILEESPRELGSAILSVLYANVDRVKRLVSHHFLTQKVLSERGQDFIIDFLVGQGEAAKTIETCGEIWSRHTLVTQMSTQLHSQLSNIILKMLDHCTKEELQSCKATSLIMSGVTTHIGISSPEIRKLGLMIGEKITAILIPEQAVKFDELHKEEEKSDKNENEENIKNKFSDSSDSDADLDIDAEWAEGADEKDDSSDDDLIPYKIDDDVGADNLPVLHPRELIKLFRTDENDVDRFRKYQSAIAGAADVCRRTTDLELDQMGAELLSTILNADNEYNMDDFDSNRRDALVALMTKFPVKAAKLVTDVLKRGRDISLGRKIQLLAAIGYAASELTELPKPEREDIIEGHMLRWGDPKNTRRWGSALHKVKAVKAANRFSPCAAMYFYGILRGADLQRLLREDDGLEAANVLTTLAVVIEAAGESVLELPRMSTDLLDVAAALAPIRPPNARRALLFAISCAVRALKDYRGNDFIGEFLVKTAEEDPEEDVRNIAIGTCSILAQRHEDDMESIFRPASQ